MMKPILKYFFILLLVLLIGIQYVGVDRSVPDYDADSDFLTLYNPPVDIRSIVELACYDCHSYETTYPWYSNIQPVAWWLQDHIKEGRDEMNFSTWQNYSLSDKDHYMEEIIEVVDEEEMPLPSYTWIHREAVLTEQQRSSLTDWISDLRTSLQDSTGVIPGEGADH